MVESIVEKERSKGVELKQTLKNVVSLKDAVTCVKPYERLFQKEKQNTINIAYHQGHILHKFKDCKELIGRLVKNLKMSKSTITFKINLCKLLRKFPLLRQSTKSIISKKLFGRLS